MELFIDDRLATQLNSIAYNITNDWDVVLVISGDRTVRVGKSVLGLTIGAYMVYALKMFGIESRFSQDNVFFDSQRMLKEAIDMPKHSIIQYDEGREGLAANKHMQKLQQDLLDFFAECGQLNHIFIIVLPDFFLLKEEMAVPRAEFLLNVFRQSRPKNVKTVFGDQTTVIKWDRGQFQFYSRSRKAQLYDNSRRTNTKWYNPKISNFVGRFNDQYPFPKGEYEKLKLIALHRFKEEKTSPQDDRNFRNAWILDQHNRGIKGTEIHHKLKTIFGVDVSPDYVYTLIKKAKSRINSDNITI